MSIARAFMHLALRWLVDAVCREHNDSVHPRLDRPWFPDERALVGLLWYHNVVQQDLSHMATHRR